MTEERSTKAFKVKITKKRTLIEEGSVIAIDEKAAMELVKEGKFRSHREYGDEMTFVSEDQIIEVTE